MRPVVATGFSPVVLPSMPSVAFHSSTSYCVPSGMTPVSVIVSATLMVFVHSGSTLLDWASMMSKLSELTRLASYQTMLLLPSMVGL